MPVKSTDVTRKFPNLNVGQTVAGIIFAREPFHSDFGAGERLRLHLVRPRGIEDSPELSILKTVMLTELFGLFELGDYLIIRRDADVGRTKMFTWDLFQHKKGERPSWATEEDVIAAGKYVDAARGAAPPPPADAKAGTSPTSVPQGGAGAAPLSVEDIPF